MSESIAGELWRPVAGFEELYQVSDHGRLWSSRSQIFLAPSLDGWGYRRANLHASGVRRSRFVHHLVLEAFVGPCPPGLECRHGPGGLTDNRLVNLCWGTKSDNTRDQVRQGTHYFAARTHCPRGHELCEANVQPNLRRRGYRGCWACARAYSDAITARRRGQVVVDMYATADGHYARLLAD